MTEEAKMEGLREHVCAAMADAWGEICDDTGCHPLDLRRAGRKVFFVPNHWADLTALRLQERLSQPLPGAKTMNKQEIVERLQEFADPDGRIPFPIVDQDGKQIGVARRTPEEMTTSEAFVDEVGTAWTQPTAWAYFAVCRTRDAQEATIARLREALEPSGDTKAAYMGEFSFHITETHFEEVTETFEESQRKVYVPWTTIKEIMDAISARAQPKDIDNGR